MSETRLHVGGLPSSINDSDLRGRFQSFGAVANVFIVKRDADSATTSPKVFAYVTLKADTNSVKKCISTLHKTKWKGGQLTVAVAKESYVDRIRRQRDAEAAEANAKKLRADMTAPSDGELAKRDGWTKTDDGRVIPVLKLQAPGTSKSKPSQSCGMHRQFNDSDIEVDGITPTPVSGTIIDDDGDAHRYGQSRRQPVAMALAPSAGQRKHKRATAATDSSTEDDAPMQHSPPPVLKTSSKKKKKRKHRSSSSSSSSEGEDKAPAAAGQSSSHKKSGKKMKKTSSSDDSSVAAEKSIPAVIPEKQQLPPPAASASTNYVEYNSSSSDGGGSWLTLPGQRRGRGSVANRRQSSGSSSDGNSSDADKEDGSDWLFGGQTAKRPTAVSTATKPTPKLARAEKKPAIPPVQENQEETEDEEEEEEMEEDQEETEDEEEVTEEEEDQEETEEEEEEEVTEEDDDANSVEEEQPEAKKAARKTREKHVVLSVSDDEAEKAKKVWQSSASTIRAKASLLRGSSDSDSESDSGEAEDSDTFRIRPQFEGKSGAKLLRLQQRFGNDDDRFKLDTRFAGDGSGGSDDDDADGDNDKDVDGNAEKSGDAGVPSGSEDEDVDVQLKRDMSQGLSVLSDMFGKKMDAAPQRTRLPAKSIWNLCQRYDPTDKTTHHLVKEVAPKEKVPKNIRFDSDDEEFGGALKANTLAKATPAPTVSKERVFRTSKDLKDLFGGSNEQQESFSFLGGGSGAGDDESDTNVTAAAASGDAGGSGGDSSGIGSADSDAEERPVPAAKRRQISRPAYESSDEEEAQEEVSSTQLTSDAPAVLGVQAFFLTIPELKAAYEEMMPKRQSREEIFETWKQEREQLTHSYKRQHKDAKRRLRQKK